MFKKLFKKLSIPILAGLLIAGVVSAQIGGFSPIGTPSFWRLDGNAIQPVNSTYEIGSSSSRIAKIWASDGDFSTLTFGGVASSDIDMSGNDIINIDQLKGNSASIKVGTGTPVSISGEGSLYIQSGVETDGSFFAPDNNGIVVGEGEDAAFMYSNADPNSNLAYIGLPTGDATNSPTLLVGELADGFTDLGYYNGETQPGIALIDASGAKTVDLRWDGTYFRFGSNSSATQYLFEPTLNLNQTIVANNSLLSAGSTAAFSLKRNTIFGDDDIRMSLGTEPLVIGNAASVNTGYSKGVVSRPTLFLTSETAFASATDEYINWYHDTNRPRYISGKGAMSIGTGTPDTLASETTDDLFVSGEIEVDGLAHFDQELKALGGKIWVTDGRAGGLQFIGTAGTRAGIIYTADEGMSLVAGNLDNFGNHEINVISGTYQLSDYDRDTLQTDPHVNIFSGADPDSDNQQFISLYHNRTDSMLSSHAGDFRFESDEQKGQSTNIRTNTETISFSTNPGDASISTTTLIPDGAFLVGLTTRVTTTATNCSNVSIGDGTDINMFGNTTGITLGTTTDNSDATAQFAMSPAIGTQNVTITANGGNCFDGAWAVTAHYIDATAATTN